MKAAEVQQKTDDELTDQLASLRKEALNLRFQRATGQLEATSRMREVRRDIARIMTVRNQRRRAAAKG